MVDFNPKFMQSGTRELKHYQHALDYWSAGAYTGNTEQFPDTLYKNMNYEFVFVQRFLQGNSFLNLKISYATKDEALTYFNKYQSLNVEKEFNSTKNYRLSDYCYIGQFGFESKYELPENSLIKLFKAAQCPSKNVDSIRYGGVVSGLALDTVNFNIVCFARMIN